MMVGEKKANKRKTFNELWRRYALTGAALGLYFGLFFRPVRQPSLLFVVGIALLATVATIAVKLLRKDRPPLTTLPRNAAVTFVQFALLLAVLEGRHLAYDAGGKILTAAFTTVLGGISGVWWAYAASAR